MDNHESTDEITKTIYKDPGVIPNYATAAKIAFVYLSQVCGKETIIEEFPLTSHFTGEYWVISGTLHSKLGGVAHISLKKENGMVFSIFHEK